MIQNKYRPPKRKPILWFILAAIILIALGLLIYNLPPVHSRLAWRVEAMRARVKYALNPPEDIILQVSTQDAEPSATLPYIIVTSTATPGATPTQAPIQASSTPILSPTPSPTITPTSPPMPSSIKQSGFTHKYQT